LATRPTSGRLLYEYVNDGPTNLVDPSGQDSQNALWEKLPAWFTNLDSDSDGQVSLREWVQAGRRFSDFRTIDKNDDGFITAQEMAAYLQKTAQRPSPTGAAQSQTEPGAGQDGMVLERNVPVGANGVTPPGATGGAAVIQKIIDPVKWHEILLDERERKRGQRRMA
jgi:hypothetical protein